LIERMFGGCRTAAQEPDLLVLVDVFADYLQCLEDRVGLLGREVTDPLQDDGGVLVYPKRLQYFCERAKSVSRVAVIDMSDSRA